MLRIPISALAVAWLLAIALAARADERVLRTTVDERVVPPFDLYETAPTPDDALRGLSLGRWKVLHQERVDGLTWMLLALPDGEIAGDVAGSRPRYLGRVREGERVVLVAPPREGEGRDRTGRAVTLSPSGAGVAVTAETSGRLARRAHGVFRPLERPLPVPRPRPGGPPASFRVALERASRVGAGGPDLRAAEDVRRLVDSVRVDFLEADVRALSQRASGAPDSRWWNPGRPGDASSIEAKSAYVRDRLTARLGPGSVHEHGFEIQAGPGESVRVYNIVGRLASRVTGAGAILLTAHLDATGMRSDPAALWAAGYKDASGCDSTALDTDPDCAWDSATDPAPGADDNATGIAALLEAARLFAGLDFDFDVYFVAFQAEELGLLGSAAFADSVAGADQEIYAVLNLDMIGYNALTNEVDVVADNSSEWIADWLAESARLFVSQLPVEKKIEPFGRSDHASFWARGIDAVLLNEDTRVLYPAYHTFQDTWQSTFPVSGRPNSVLQFQYVTQLLVAALARFAVQYTAPDLALPAGEVSAEPLAGRDFVVGNTLRLRAHVHNLGNSSLTFADETTDSLTARVTFWRGDPDQGGEPVGEMTRKAFFAAGGIVDFETLWNTAGVAPGFVEVFAKVEGLDVGYTQEEVSPTNNQTSQSFFLEAPASEGPRVISHYAYPNPVRGTREGLTLYYELTQDAGVAIDVFDLAGTVVGRFRAAADFIADGNRAGPNSVDSRAFDWTGPQLESGVYLYTIRAFRDGRSSETRGKFAILR